MHQEGVSLYTRVPSLKQCQRGVCVSCLWLQQRKNFQGSYFNFPGYYQPPSATLYHWDHPSMPGTTGTKKKYNLADGCMQRNIHLQQTSVGFSASTALLSTWQCNRNWCATRWNGNEFDWKLLFFFSQVTSIHSPKVATFEWWQNMLELALWHCYETLERGWW